VTGAGVASRVATRARRAGLAVRLLAAQLLVLVTAVVTAWLVAAAVGPSIFRDHLGQVSHTDSPGRATDHAEQAFRDASVLSLGVASVAALAAALAVSAFVTHRIARPVAALADAASEVAAGRFDVTVPAPSLGAEFDTLTRSFTEMAVRLHRVETTRRRLLADLAHEMRTPVATLDGYLEGFEDGVATLDPDTAVMLRIQTRRLARLAEDVSAVSRAEENQLELHPTVTTARRLVDGALAAAADRYADKGVAICSDVQEHLPDVRVDPDRLGQVLGNLLDNALRHTAHGGTVTVAAAAADGHVLLQVADTGTGIPPEHLPHVFERFYRVDTARSRADGGSGIGLAITKALVEAHGGRITATSSGPGRGAQFTVQLPPHEAA
jgi:two-component system, OmpR family, sensor histidine kinase BaeS